MFYRVDGWGYIGVAPPFTPRECPLCLVRFVIQVSFSVMHLACSGPCLAGEHNEELSA